MRIITKPNHLAISLACLLLLNNPIALAAPPSCNAAAEGTIVYNTDHKAVQFCNGADWIAMSGNFGGGGGSSVWQDGGSGKVYYDSGNVGIGTNDPERALHIVGDGGIGDDFLISSYSDTNANWAGSLAFYRARGTEGTPTAVLAGDYLSSIGTVGYQGSTWAGTGSIVALAEKDFASEVDSAWTFSTVNDGTASEKMRITANGSVGIGIDDPNANTLLHIRAGGDESAAGQLLIDSGSSNNFLMIDPSVGNNNWTTLTEPDDTAIIFSGGAQDTGGLVIAPWSSTGVGNRGLRMAANGNVGIGAASPTSLLHINRGDYGAVQLGDNDAGGFHITKENTDDSFNIWSGVVGSGINRFKISSNGSVGIGTNDPGSPLEIYNSTINTVLHLHSGDDWTNVLFTDPVGTTRIESRGSDLTFQTGGAPDASGLSERLRILGNGNVGIGTASPSALLHVNGTAVKPGGGSWAASSDARLKKVDKEYQSGLDAIAALSPVRFHYKDGNPRGEPTDKEYIGLVAQDAQAVMPELVSEGDDGFLNLDPSALTFALINAVKELKAENDKIRADFEAYKAANR